MYSQFDLQNCNNQFIIKLWGGRATQADGIRAHDRRITYRPTMKGENMNINEITLMLNAGFTKDEIMRIVDYPIPATPEAAEPEAAPAEPAEPEAPEAEPAEPAPANDDVLKELIKTVKGLSDTVKDMQKTNAKKATGGKTVKKTSADVITDFFQS